MGRRILIEKKIKEMDKRSCTKVIKGNSHSDISISLLEQDDEEFDKFMKNNFQ